MPWTLNNSFIQIETGFTGEPEPDHAVIYVDNTGQPFMKLDGRTVNLTGNGSNTSAVWQYEEELETTSATWSINLPATVNDYPLVRFVFQLRSDYDSASSDVFYIHRNGDQSANSHDYDLKQVSSGGNAGSGTDTGWYIPSVPSLQNASWQWMILELELMAPRSGFNRWHGSVRGLVSNTQSNCYGGKIGHDNGGVAITLDSLLILPNNGNILAGSHVSVVAGYM